MKKLAKIFLTKIFTAQARAIVNKYRPKVVVVVGSIGKTSTKLAIAKVLSAKYSVQYQDGNYNVPLSVPFVISGQEYPGMTNYFQWIKAWRQGQKILKNGYSYDFVVLEYGTDHPGEIAEFAKLPKPDITVISGIAAEHMEFFKTISAVAKEELSVSQYSKQLIVNADSTEKKYIDEFVSKNVPIKTYGAKGCDYQLSAKKTDGMYYDFLVTTDTGNNIADCKTNMIGIHSLLPLAAAVSVATEFGLSVDEINKAISQIEPPAGRMRVFDAKNNSKIIDDTYNASPIAVIAGLNTLYNLKANQRIALLGNMNELGDYSLEAHKQVGEHCNPEKLDLVVTIGEDANKYLADAAEGKGCKVVRCTNPVKAGQVILENLEEGSVVFAKGSQNGVFAEEAVKILLARSDDVTKLVRQSKIWLTTKKNQFPEIV